MSFTSEVGQAEKWARRGIPPRCSNVLIIPARSMAENESADVCVDQSQQKQMDLPALTILANMCVFGDKM